MPEVFDATRCELGEGALWHPERGELIWFDILNRKMFRRGSGETVVVEFDEMASASAWVDVERIIVATETQIALYNLVTCEMRKLCDLEADNAQTRSNDGRADPWGGFWIGTMGKSAQADAGAIYRFYKGDLRKLFPQITIPNSICFAPDRSCAYFADTAQAKLFTVALDQNGWPDAEPEVLIDFEPLGLFPDGAVTDANGCLWIAHWGAAKVGVYGPHGAQHALHPVPAAQVSCPAFGGRHFGDLYCTSALEGLSPVQAAEYEGSGQTFRIWRAGNGRPEPAFDLSGCE